MAASARSTASAADFLPAVRRPRRCPKRYRTTGGDLIRVIGRDGTVKRSFTYQNNLMVSHTDAAGLTAYYEYSHYTPTGKVLRNRTSLG